MLPSLRPLIAESMEDLADVTAKTMVARCAYAGAATLRWCDAHEGPSVEELQAEVEHLAAALEESEGVVGDLVANVRFAVSKWEHGDECPAGQPEACGDAVCDCALVERRKSVLDAMA